jgi:hypothetical protein
MIISLDFFVAKLVPLLNVNWLTATELPSRLPASVQVGATVSISRHIPDTANPRWQ